MNRRLICCRLGHLCLRILLPFYFLFALPLKVAETICLTLPLYLFSTLIKNDTTYFLAGVGVGFALSRVLFLPLSQVLPYSSNGDGASRILCSCYVSFVVYLLACTAFGVCSTLALIRAEWKLDQFFTFCKYPNRCIIYTLRPGTYLGVLLGLLDAYPVSSLRPLPLVIAQPFAFETQSCELTLYFPNWMLYAFVFFIGLVSCFVASETPDGHPKKVDTQWQDAEELYQPVSPNVPPEQRRVVRFRNDEKDDNVNEYSDVESAGTTRSTDLP